MIMLSSRFSLQLCEHMLGPDVSDRRRSRSQRRTQGAGTRGRPKPCDAGAKPAQKDFGSSWRYYNKNCFQQRAQFPRPTVTEWQVEQASEQHA